MYNARIIVTGCDHDWFDTNFIRNIKKYYRENKTDDGDKIMYRKNMATWGDVRTKHSFVRRHPLPLPLLARDHCYCYHFRVRSYDPAPQLRDVLARNRLYPRQKIKYIYDRLAWTYSGVWKVYNCISKFPKSIWVIKSISDLILKQDVTGQRPISTLHRRSDGRARPNRRATNHHHDQIRIRGRAHQIRAYYVLPNTGCNDGIN